MLSRCQGERRVAGGLHPLKEIVPPARSGRSRGQGDPIHGYAIKGRLVALGVDILAQHRAGALRQGERFDRQAHEVTVDEPTGHRRVYSSLFIRHALFHSWILHPGPAIDATEWCEAANHATIESRRARSSV